MNLRFSSFASLLLVLAAPSAASAPHLGGGASADVSVVRVFLTLLFCLIVAVLAIFLIRQRYGSRGSSFFSRMGTGSQRLRVVESRRIGPQSDLCLVECDELEYLLLITPGGPLLVKEHRAPAPADR